MNYSKSRRYHIYVLKLENEKYYIGITSRTPEERFREHKNAYHAAEWTKIHRPLRILQVRDLGITSYEKAEAYENKITRIYVKKYGLDNVRGGNINYRGKMVKRVGFIWRLEDWADFRMAWSAAFVLILCTIYIIWDALVRH